MIGPLTDLIRHSDGDSPKPPRPQNPRAQPGLAPTDEPKAPPVTPGLGPGDDVDPPPET
jgi:hypothetical protein